jgi:hypothetical protein
LGRNTKRNCFSSCEYSGGNYVAISTPFFRRPILFVEHNEGAEPDTFAPAHTFLDLQGPYVQKYLRIRIRNKGAGTAHKCSAQLRIIIPKDTNATLFPSRDAKQLTWGRSPDKSDISSQIDIHPKIGEGILHVVFSDSRFNSILIRDAQRKYASASIHERLERNELRVEDGFSQGTFLVDVVVSSEEAYCRTKLKITIPADYMGITMRRLSRLERWKNRIWGFRT